MVIPRNEYGFETPFDLKNFFPDINKLKSAKVKIKVGQPEIFKLLRPDLEVTSIVGVNDHSDTISYKYYLINLFEKDFRKYVTTLLNCKTLFHPEEIENLIFEISSDALTF